MRDAIFDVLVRGRQLFSPQPMRHAAPLTRLLDAALAVAADRLPAAATDALRALGSLFPARDLARLRLKSDLYEIAHLGRQYHPHLKEEFVKCLMREAPALMRSLPGFKPARLERVGKLSVPIKEEISPLVNKLIQRDALARFECLSARTASEEVAVGNIGAAGTA